jgi:hypothetical protein
MDIRTLYLCSCLVTVLLTAGILCLAWRRSQVRHVLYWAAGDWFYAIGTFGVALRGILPDWGSIVAGNATTILAMYLWLEGFQTLTGSRRFTIPGRALIVLGCAALVYFWVWDDNVTGRIMVGSAIAAIMLGFTTATLLASRLEGLRFPLLVSAGLFGVTACLSVVRFIVTMFGPSIGDYMTAPPIQGLLLLPYALAFVSQNYVFLWLVIAHDAARHAASQTDLLREVEATRAALEVQTADLRRASRP